MKRKALALFSGGLDSTLAVKVMQEQGIEVEAINFTSPFFTCKRKMPDVSPKQSVRPGARRSL